MVRSSKFLLFIIAISLCCNRSAADPPAADSAPSSEAQIYEAFLDHWAGKEHSPVNVSKSADKPTAEDLAQYTACAKEDGIKSIHWATGTSKQDLSDVVRNLSYVRFVDPEMWQLDDPEAHISKGQSVESAVNAGIDHGLLTISAISFDESRMTAAFKYSFVCGRLCGNGGVVLFEKSSKGWVRGKRSCGGWMS